jgi:hypothetical protein
LKRFHRYLHQLTTLRRSPATGELNVISRAHETQRRIDRAAPGYIPVSASSLI